MRTLPADLATAVARRLVASSLAEDPETGYQFAQDARRLAARVGIVRETAGIAAYRAGHWAEALTELRAARRLTGRTSYLPMMADAERALGRQDRALALLAEPQAGQVDRATQIELLIVESGIRRDQGLPEAAAVTLQVPELTDGRLRPWSARLFYAYADALLEAGRTEEAREWFGRAAEADRDEQTDAAERYEDLDDVVIDDLEDDEDDEDPPTTRTGPTARTRPPARTPASRAGQPGRDRVPARGPGQPAGRDLRPAADRARTGAQLPRRKAVSCRTGRQDGFSRSSQCMMPATLPSVPLTTSNRAATSGSVSAPSTAYRCLVRSRTMATA